MKKYILLLVACLLVGVSKVNAKDISLTELANELKNTTSYQTYSKQDYTVNIVTTDKSLSIDYGYTGNIGSKYTCKVFFNYSNNVLEYVRQKEQTQFCDSAASPWLADVVRSVGKILELDETKLMNWFNGSSRDELSRLTLENNGMQVNFTSNTCSAGVAGTGDECRYYTCLKIDLNNFKPFEPVTPTPSKTTNVTKNPKTADLNVSVVLASALVALAIAGYSILKIRVIKKGM